MNKVIPTHVVATAVFIIKNDKVLIARRSDKDDQAGGAWSIPGGKVELNQEPNILENNLKKEVFEEVGLEIGNIQYLISRSFIRSSGHNVIWVVFRADWVSGEAQALDDQEEIKWIDPNKLSNILDNHAKAEIEALKKTMV